MQISVKIRVEPKPRAHRPIVFEHQEQPRTEGASRARPIFDRGFEQWVPSEPAPCF